MIRGERREDTIPWERCLFHWFYLFTLLCMLLTEEKNGDFLFTVTVYHPTPLLSTVGATGTNRQTMSVQVAASPGTIQGKTHTVSRCFGLRHPHEPLSIYKAWLRLWKDDIVDAQCSTRSCSLNLVQAFSSRPTDTAFFFSTEHSQNIAGRGEVQAMIACIRSMFEVGGVSSSGRAESERHTIWYVPRRSTLAIWRWPRLS